MKFVRDEYNPEDNETIIHDFDLWNLDMVLAEVIHPALVKFKENDDLAIPEDLDEYGWNQILDKMIRSFEMIAKGRQVYISSKEKVEIQEGLDLFAKFYSCLWT